MPQAFWWNGTSSFTLSPPWHLVFLTWLRSEIMKGMYLKFSTLVQLIMLIISSCNIEPQFYILYEETMWTQGQFMWPLTRGENVVLLMRPTSRCLLQLKISLGTQWIREAFISRWSRLSMIGQKAQSRYIDTMGRWSFHLCVYVTSLAVLVSLFVSFSVLVSMDEERYGFGWSIKDSLACFHWVSPSRNVEFLNTCDPSSPEKPGHYQNSWEWYQISLILLADTGLCTLHPMGCSVWITCLSMPLSLYSLITRSASSSFSLNSASSFWLIPILM